MSAGRIWLVTGVPAIGKSTLVSRVVFALRSRGYIVGGCVTLEAKKQRIRTGFTIQDLLTGGSGELAAVEGIVGPRLGKYRISLRNLSAIGAASLLRAASEAEIIVIDEVGPMELMSPEFRRAVQACQASGKPLLAVVRERMKDPVIESMTSAPGSEILEVTLESRERLARELADQIVAVLGPLKSG